MGIIKINAGLARLMKLCALGAMVGIILGCTHSPTPREVQQFFIKNQQDLKNLVTMIKRCGGAIEISASGSSLNKLSDSRCSREGIDYRNKIAEKLKELHILWVVISWNKDNTLDGLSFVLSSHVMLMFNSDRGSAIYYFENPIRKPEKLNAGASYSLTGYPCQWFFVVFSKN